MKIKSFGARENIGFSSASSNVMPERSVRRVCNTPLVTTSNRLVSSGNTPRSDSLITNIGKTVKQIEANRNVQASSNNVPITNTTICKPANCNANSSIDNQPSSDSYNLGIKPINLDIKPINLDIKPFDWDGFDKSMADMSASWDKCDKDLADMNAKMSTGMNQLNKDVDNANKEISAGTKNIVAGMNTATAGLSEMISGVNSANAGMNKMISGVNNISAGIDKTNASINKTNSIINTVVSVPTNKTGSSTTSPISKGNEIEETPFFDGMTNFEAAVAGSAGSQLSKIEKDAFYVITVDKDDLITSVLPHYGKVQPLKILSNTSNALTILTTGDAIADTWCANNGNSTSKKILKTGIQIAGVGVSNFAGAAATAALLPETGPGAIVGGVMVDTGVSTVVDGVEQRIYKLLDIK